MPKIAIFMNSLAGGGMERAMLNLASFFVAQGASVDLLVASSKGPLLTEVPDSVNLIDLSESKSRHQSVRWWLWKAAIKLDPMLFRLCFARKLPKAVKVIPALIEYLESNNPDSVVSTPTTANLSLIWAKSYIGYDSKTIIREASTLSKVISNENSMFFKLAERFVSKWYNNADAVICVSDGVSEDLAKNFLVRKSKLVTIYNIIDIDGIKKQSLSEESNSHILQYGEFVLSAGRLEKEKDYKTLIRAFHLISGDVSVNLVILGEGSERSTLENIVNELSLSDRVFLPGFFVNPYPFIARCEVFALSSIWEGCPNVLREAMVFNRKIISTNCPSGVNELLHGGEHGTLVEVGNVHQFSKALLKLIRNVRSEVDEVSSEINEQSVRLYSNLFLK